VEDDAADVAQEDPPERAVVRRADDDEVGLALVGEPVQRPRRREVGDRGELRLDAQLEPRRLEDPPTPAWETGRRDRR
jgi:hypothetical protein